MPVATASWEQRTRVGAVHVHDCIGALKGDVHVESERGTGTTFLIELPFAPPL